MDISSIFKPIVEAAGKHSASIFLFGIGYYFFAPNYNSVGIIFILASIGGIVDRNVPFFKKHYKYWQKDKEIKSELKHLNKNEELIVKSMVKHNKRVMGKRDFDNIANGKVLPDEIYHVFHSLEDKGIITYIAGGFGGHFSLRADSRTWKVMKTVYKQDFNTAEKKEEQGDL